jgi:hypothetical protein
LTLRGLLALNAPRPLWLAGEGEDPGIVAAAFGSPLKKERLVTFTGETGQEQAAAVQWLLK